MSEIDAVVHSFATALADGRFEEACGLLTASGQKAMDDGHGSCEEGARILSRNVGQLGRQQWRDLKVLDLDSGGDRATVASEHVTPRGASIFEGGVKLRLVEGKWLVDF